MDKLARYELKRRALSVFFPNICPFCGRNIEAREYWCDECYGVLPTVRRTLTPPDGVSRLYASCWYSGVAKAAVRMLKFSCLIYPADAFGRIMSELLRDVKADALVPVPSGLKSIEKRGFSPAEVIAKRISLRLDIPVVKALVADMDKLEQKNLSAEGRRKNAQRSFHLAKRANVKGKRLLIIDDVTTTGSTLSALAGILLSAGAADVSAAVFAQVTGGFKKMKESKIYRRR